MRYIYHQWTLWLIKVCKTETVSIASQLYTTKSKEICVSPQRNVCYPSLRKLRNGDKKIFLKTVVLVLKACTINCKGNQIFISQFLKYENKI